MGNLFSGPKVQTDPGAQAAAVRQQTIADAQLTDSMQGNLVTDTRSRLRQFGIQPAAAASGGGYGGSFGGAGGNFWGSKSDPLANPALGIFANVFDQAMKRGG